MSPKNKTTILLALGIAIAVPLIIAMGWGIYATMQEKDPALNQKITNRDYNYLYGRYISYSPDISSGISYGNQNASLTIIAVLDLDSKETRYFYDEIFPLIKEEFINTGKAKYYNKQLITNQDYSEKNRRYTYYQALECTAKIKPDAYFDIYFDILNNSETNIKPERYNMPAQQFNDCIKQDNKEKISSAVSENELSGGVIGQKFYIGFKGTDNTILEGVPDYAQFRRILRNKEMMIGG